MSRFMLVSIPVLLCSVLFVSNTQARELVVSHGSKGEIVSMSGIQPDGRTEGCVVEQVSGKILALDYSEDSIRIVGMSIELDGGDRGHANLDESDGEFYSRLSRSDARQVAGFITVGARRKFTICWCGAAGRYALIDAVAVK